MLAREKSLVSSAIVFERPTMTQDSIENSEGNTRGIAALQDATNWVKL